MATTFVRVQDPELAADLELGGLLWMKYPSGNLLHVPEPTRDLPRKVYVDYWNDSGVLWSNRMAQYGYLSEE